MKSIIVCACVYYLSKITNLKIYLHNYYFNYIYNLWEGFWIVVVSATVQ